MLASLRKNGIRLALFAIGCTALVAITDHFTRQQIAFQESENLQQKLSQMLPPGSYDNELSNSCRLLLNPDYLGDNRPHPIYVARKGSKVSGLIIESIAPNGYSGAIRLLTGITADGKISRIQVLEHRETPGLGDKIDRSKSSWIDSFNHHSLHGATDPRWAVKRDGGMFDAFTGATITPRAVVAAVKRVLVLLEEQPALIEQAKSCQESP